MRPRRCVCEGVGGDVSPLRLSPNAPPHRRALQLVWRRPSMPVPESAYVCVCVCVYVCVWACLLGLPSLACLLVAIGISCALPPRRLWRTQLLPLLLVPMGQWGLVPQWPLAQRPRLPAPSPRPWHPLMGLPSCAVVPLCPPAPWARPARVEGRRAQGGHHPLLWQWAVGCPRTRAWAWPLPLAPHPRLGPLPPLRRWLRP